MSKTELEDFLTIKIYKDYSKIKLDKKYDWQIPGIAGLLVIISIFLPAAYTSAYRNPFGTLYSIDMLWIWNFYATFVNTSISLSGEFLNVSHVLITISVILTCLILIIGFFFLVSAIRIKRKRITYEKSKKLWIKLSIILVFLVLSWIVLMEIFSDENIILKPAYIGANIQRYSFWSYFSPEFAIYGFFLSFTIIGLRIALDKSYKKSCNYLYFIAFTLMIVSFFTPLVNYNAFVIDTSYPDAYYFTFEPAILFNIFLMTCLVIFIICITLTFIFTLKINKFRGLFKKFWYFEKILASSIFFVITFCLLLLNMNYEYSQKFWEETYRSQPILGFGIIGPYVSAFLIIFGVFLEKSIER
jgi:hypothetical protein